MRSALAFLLMSISAATMSSQLPTMFRGDAAHTGVMGGKPPKTLSLRWKFQTGAAVVSSPSVVDGTLYVGSADRHVYALDAVTGDLRWKFDAHGDVNSSPAVSDGSVYALSLDGNLYAIDARTGAQRWVFATEGERRFSAPGLFGMLPHGESMPDPWDVFLSSPTVVKGVVYFGSGDSHVYAVDASTGKLRWKFRTGNVVHSSPAVSDGLVYIGSWDTYLYALGADDGSLVWKFKTGDDNDAHLMTGIQGSPAVARGRVYFGSRDANLYALDAKTGALAWKIPTDGSWVISSPALLAGKLYVVTSDSEKFMALDAATGKLLYALPDHIYAFSSVVISGSRAYFGTFDGILHAVDLEKQAYAGEFAADGHSDDRSRYLDAGGRLKQDTVWTGDTLDDTMVDLRSKVFSMGSILSSPTIAAGRVYVGSVDGAVYSLGDP